jgi:hypothetical protein
LHDGWIEAAARGIGDQAVLRAVERVAGIDRGAMQHLRLGRRQPRRFGLLQRFYHADGLSGAAGPVEAR